MSTDTIETSRPRTPAAAQAAQLLRDAGVTTMDEMVTLLRDVLTPPKSPGPRGFRVREPERPEANPGQECGWGDVAASMDKLDGASIMVAVTHRRTGDEGHHWTVLVNGHGLHLMSGQLVRYGNPDEALKAASEVMAWLAWHVWG